jgi:hypothetical protein
MWAVPACKQVALIQEIFSISRSTKYKMWVKISVVYNGIGLTYEGHRITV